jgi:hypothetical protein
MKPLILSALFIAAGYAADAPKLDPDLQAEIMSDLLDLREAQIAAQPYVDTFNTAKDKAQKSMAKGYAVCGEGFTVAKKEHQLVCQPKPDPAKPEPKK